jgi:hypothetical protein
MESTICTTEQLKQLTSLSNNIDVELLQPHLLIAQQLYVASILGDALYNDICNRYDNNQLTGDTLTLYSDYIIPAIGFAAWFSVAPFLAYKTTRAGIQTQSASDGANVAVIPEELSLYIARVENFKNFYCQRLNQFLIDDDGVKYPLFRSGDDTPVETNKGGTLYLGFGKKQNTEPCCENNWQFGR